MLLSRDVHLIRAIDPSETGPWFDTLQTAFLERWDPRIVDDVQSLWDFRRVWAAVEDDPDRGHGPIPGRPS